MVAIRAALVGHLEEVMTAEIADLATAHDSAVIQTAEMGKTLLRRQVRRAKLGEGLEKAWRVMIFPPKRRRQRSLAPAALIFSKAVRLHAAFDEENNVRAKNAKWLVIPTDAAVKSRLARSVRRSKGSRPRKWSEVAAAVDRFGGLDFVRVDRDTAILVARKATRTGRVSRAKRRRRGDRGQVLFILKRQVRSPKLLNIDRVFRRLDRFLISRLQREYLRLDRAA